MFRRFFRRRQRRYIWLPALDFRDGRIAAALFLFSNH